MPSSHWKKTPVVLKATAGLRLLPEHKAEALLSEVTLEGDSCWAKVGTCFFVVESGVVVFNPIPSLLF